MPRTGRRPGNQDTREAILSSARKAFSEKGFDGASIRSIATGAGVDPALVHHYFGTKDQLFTATLELPVDVVKVMTGLAADGLDGFGERLVRTILGVWDSPAGSAAAALVRSAVAHEWTARLMREFLLTQILRRVLGSFDIDPAEAPTRANLVASQMIGLLLMRYIIKLEPLAHMDPEDVARMVGPTIQRYLTEPLK
ncbi:TetR family transcriptional regulator [Virgisporangium aliadipatigenens]|uniref:TetR family transcriptional regulator n=1 Tax=Virgisporangium aliadipatigenens TaxID=741659 RepID=A0A8J3YUY9_9ACTN|nr:TetR family transcriptional regulator [Virgisporangium aliadipatigenens]GIJ52021.1 TetR family transcriptional regulator [Virgisporangium aliadipatigenens]